MLLDTTHNIGTPEGVELRLPVAGIAPRALAWLIDALIKYSALLFVGTGLSILGQVGDGLMLIFAFLGLWFYNVLFEVLMRGATPGKRVLGLRVMNENGTPVGWSGSMIRNLIRFVDVLPGCYGFGCMSVMLSKNFQRLGDLAAGTIVIHQPKQKLTLKASAAAPIPLTEPLSLATTCHRQFR